MPNFTLSQALQQAIQFLQKGELQQAESFCQQILQAVPNQPDALHLLGIVFYQAKRYQDAIQLIQQAISYYPKLFDAYYNLAMIYTELKQYQEAIVWYEKGFAQTILQQNSINTIENILIFICKSPPIKWHESIPHFVNYAECLYQTDQLQIITDSLPNIISNYLKLEQLSENEAELVILTLLKILKFDKLTERVWNTFIFQHVALQCLKQALSINYYELALILEGYIYNHYVKQKETEENFRTSFSQWVGDMCAAGKKVKETLPLLDKSVLNDTIPTIGFFIHRELCDYWSKRC